LKNQKNKIERRKEEKLQNRGFLETRWDINKATDQSKETSDKGILTLAPRLFQYLSEEDVNRIENLLDTQS